MRTVVGIRPSKRVRRASSHTEKPMPTAWFDSWRIRIREDHFLAQQIPLASFTEQQTIVSGLDTLADKARQVNEHFDCERYKNLDALQIKVAELKARHTRQVNDALIPATLQRVFN